MSTQISQQLLSSLINAEELYEEAPCGYLSFLPDGFVIKINKTLLTWLGFAREEILFQKKFVDLISKSGKIHYEIFFRPMINMNGSIKEMSYDLMKKDNTLLPVLLSATTVKDSAGIVMAVNLAVSDNTDRQKYEHELRLAKGFAETEKRRFEYLANLIPEIVWTANIDGVIEYVNMRFFQYFNLPANAFDAALIWSKIHSTDRLRILRLWLKSIHLGNDFQAEVRLKKGYNDYQWHLLRAIPYRDEQYIITKWFGSCANIHEHIMAIERKDEFIKIASHELKTPLTTLKAYIQFLETCDIEKQYKTFIESASKSANKLQFLISSLLDVSNLNAGELVLNLSNFSLTGVITETIEQLNYSYSTHQIALDNDSAEQFMVYADKERIIQVIINLLNNAVKYSPGEKRIIVKLNKHGHEKTVTVEVIDFGPGVSKDKQELIFEKYYRVNENSRSPVMGLGLGLYITQNIMLSHKSRVFVKNNVDHGSIFYFSLPYV